MSTTGTTVEGYAAVRGVAALAVMLAAARMPDRFAGPGAALAARIAPPEAPEVPVVPVVPVVTVPAQRARPTSARTATGPSMTA